MQAAEALPKPAASPTCARCTGCGWCRMSGGGTGVHLAAALQFMAAHVPDPFRPDPVEPILEFDRTPNPLRQEVLQQPIEHENGWVAIPDGPGLGIEVNRDALAEFAAGG
ncbi:enolase C-terminal domain-like protein [Jhaorihella thermophila]